MGPRATLVSSSIGAGRDRFTDALELGHELLVAVADCDSQSSVREPAGFAPVSGFTTQQLGLIRE